MKVKSIADITRDHIENLIITNEFKPGQQIKEEDISERLGVSRPPIREAFKVLEEQGLVVRIPRRGTFVPEMTKKDVQEIYILKASLYSLATSLAMDRFTDRHRNTLCTIVQRMAQAAGTKDGDILKYQKIHQKFHVMIMEVAGNQRLLNFASNLHKQIKRFSYQTLHFQEHLDTSRRFHEQIVQKILENDKEKACRLMQEHVLDAMHFLLNLSRCSEKGTNNQRQNTKTKNTKLLIT
jgi:DNA-binding GntR family transcriptional regulator